jgi:LysR family pca operon transcriptional activator
MSGLTFEQLLVDRYILVARPGHPAATDRRSRLADLSDYPLILPSRETVTWSEIERLYVSQGARMTSARVETMYLEFSRAHTLGTNAVWFASTLHVHTDIAQGALVQLPVDCSMLESPLGIIDKPERSFRPMCRQFLDFLRNTIALRQAVSLEENHN